MMTKKILFLLTFLLTTLGGGQLWADTYTIAYSGKSSDLSPQSNGTNYDYTYTFPNGLTMTYTREANNKYLSGGKEDCIKYSNGCVYSVSGIPNTEVITSIAFYGYSNNSGKTSTLYLNNVCTDKTFSESATGYTLSDLSLVGGFSFKADGAETGLKITITTDDRTIDNIYSGTYPYTWDFHVPAEQWTKSKKQLTNSPSWYNNGNEARLGSTSASADNGIDIIKGLAFSDVTAATSNSEENFTKGTLCLDWTHQWLWMNGKVTIPSLKVGQKVIFTSEDAVTYSSGTGNVDVSSGKVFNITSPGDVTFTVSGGVWSIAVVKNDLTTFAFNNTETYYGESGDSPSENNKCTGEFIGRTTTFKYKVGRSQVLRTRVDIEPGLNVTGITVNSTNFTLTSDNNNNILDPTSCYVSSYDATTYHKFNYGSIKVKKPGTASLTYSFNGTDAYNAKNYTELFTIQKDDIDLKFASDFVVKTVGEAAFTNTFTLNGLTLPFTDDNAETFNASTFTYEVKTADNKNTSYLVSVDGNGQVTLSSTPGVVNIHVKHVETNWYNEVDRSYRLVVNPSSGTTPTLQWNDGVSSTSIPYNDAATHVATETTSTGQNIKYRSANNSIASVDAEGKVTGTGIGTTTIYAYIEPTETNRYAEISYTIDVTKAGELTSFRFAPNEGKVNKGKSITPKLAFPTIPASGVTSLKVTQIKVTEREGHTVSETFTDNTISDCDIISVDAFDNLRNNWELDGVNKVFKVNVTIKGKKVGKARITVTFESNYYETATATYDVEVTDAGTRNFSWTEGGGSPEYYTYAGDFMMLPALTGNSNGNYNYSSGAKNSSSYTEGGDSHSALHAYEYERKWAGSNFNITWNNKNIKIGEGFPDFAIVTDEISSPGTASVFFGRGEGSSHPDTLMVYCEKAGDVKLRAYDPQDHTKYCDATIHILPISNIEGGSGAATTIKSGMTYPYTWDFTTNFDMANMVGSTDQYWMPIKDNNGNATGEYTNGYGFFNLDWADVDKDNATNDRIYKHFIIGASNTKDGYMHQFNGMMLQMKGSTSWANRIDRMRILNYDGTNNRGRLQFIGGYHTLKIHVPTTLPSSFKIFVKASGTGKLCIMGLDEKAVSGKEKSLTSDPQIYSFDNTDVPYMGSEGYILLGFDDARVDWIAMSTESKTLAKFENTKYWASTYSYQKGLDLKKSHEAFPNVTAHYASAFSGQNEVTMTKVPNDAVPSGTGMLLKATTTDNPGASYFIANAENVSVYSAPSPISGTNYLKANPEVGTKINANTTIGETQYTNFTLAYRYKVVHAGGGIDSNYTMADDWSFYRIAPSGITVSNKNLAYLQVPGDLYIDAYSSRRAGDATGANPASQELLKIVFDDDNNTGTTDLDISTVTPQTVDNGAWYTLQGVRVSAPLKGGIYIHNGKKIVVK